MDIEGTTLQQARTLEEKADLLSELIMGLSCLETRGALIEQIQKDAVFMDQLVLVLHYESSAGSAAAAAAARVLACTVLLHVLAQDVTGRSILYLQHGKAIMSAVMGMMANNDATVNSQALTLTLVLLQDAAIAETMLGESPGLARLLLNALIALKPARADESMYDRAVRETLLQVIHALAAATADNRHALLTTTADTGHEMYLALLGRVAQSDVPIHAVWGYGDSDQY